jgi:hypothetical protein
MKTRLKSNTLSPVLSLGAALICYAVSAQSSAAAVIAATTEFSGVQGQNNWFYGYRAGSGAGYTPAAFVPIGDSRFIGGVWDFAPSPNFLTIGMNTWHPNGGSGTGSVQSPAKRWVVEDTGWITISGQWRSNDTARGAGLDATTRNGTTVRIYLEGVQVYSQKVAWNAYPNANDYSVTLPMLTGIGDNLDFLVDYDGDVNDDSTFWTATVDLIPVPEPSAVLLCGIVIPGLLARRRRSWT